MSIDKALKEYKSRLKDEKSTLQELHDRAREISEQQALADTARTSLSQVQADIQDLTDEKLLLREEISEAVILEDPALPEMRERFVGLDARVKELQDELDRLSTVMEENTPDPDEVASIKAQLQGIKKGVSGTTLEKAISDTVAGDNETLRARAKAADALLPSVDVVNFMHALASVGRVDRRTHDNALQTLQHETEAGRGEKAKQRLAYQLEGILRR